MNPDEVFVGILALSFSLVAFSIGIGPWLAPYRLRTIHGIAQRYGKAAARTVWVTVSIALLAAGLAILFGMRPGYVGQVTKGAAVDTFSKREGRSIAIRQ
ncbi:MAG: hypothetical protein OSA98_17395 [Rubripirellula sp.]|nr:hypothetical protein [Rubripirellula sp.]